MVIGRRNINHDSENSLLDLRGSNLSLTQLDNGSYDFSKAIFVQTLLFSIKWDNVILESARFNCSNLTRASFEECCFKEALLESTIVNNAEFFKCNLRKASFRGAKEFDSRDWVFKNSEIQGTDFMSCNTLTQDNLKDAIGDETTKLPENLEMPESWKSTQDNNQK